MNIDYASIAEPVVRSVTSFLSVGQTKICSLSVQFCWLTATSHQAEETRRNAGEVGCQSIQLGGARRVRGKTIGAGSGSGLSRKRIGIGSGCPKRQRHQCPPICKQLKPRPPEHTALSATASTASEPGAPPGSKAKSAASLDPGEHLAPLTVTLWPTREEISSLVVSTESSQSPWHIPARGGRGWWGLARSASV